MRKRIMEGIEVTINGEIINTNTGEIIFTIPISTFEEITNSGQIALHGDISDSDAA